MLASLPVQNVSPVALLSLLAVGAVVLFLASSVLSAALSPLRSLPGPALARYTRLWYLKAVIKGNFQETNIRLHEEQGPIVRIAPGQYSINDPDAMKIIYGHGTEFVKAPWYRASVRPNEIHELFMDPNPKRHAAKRRQVAHLYSTSNLLQFESFVDSTVKLMTDRMHELAASGRTFDLQYWLQCYAFDVISLISFNKRFGFLDEGNDGGLFGELSKYLQYTARVGVFNEWHSFAFWVLSFLPETGFSFIAKFASDQVIETTKQAATGEKLTGRNDFVAKLLRMHWDDPMTYPMEWVYVTAGTNVGAGSDTTSISLTGIMYGLMRHPDCYQRLRTEIEDAVAAGKASSPIRYQEAQALPYLQACIKEGLRMNPATGLPLARVVPAGGATISGTFFPAGSVVGVNTWVAHRNRSVFGDDADTFNPDRWLDNSERVAKMDRYYFPFGAGSRTCIGRNISLLEISKLIPELVRQLDFSLAHPEEKLQLDNSWFVKQQNVICRVDARK